MCADVLPPQRFQRRDNPEEYSIQPSAGQSQDSPYLTGPTAYTVAQGICFFKPSEDPQSSRIIKAKRKTGQTLYTTGQLWRGPSGGIWAEVDVARSPNEMGWALVSGPGFGLKGPALVDPTDSQEGGTVMVCVRFTKDPIFSAVISKKEKVATLIDLLSKQCGLNSKEIILTKGLPGKAPNGSGNLLPADYTKPDDVLRNDMIIGNCQIEDMLNLIYLGSFEDDYRPGAI
eukprot:gnl/TRDRNA2_/TRDRNA2_185473_c0_seq1.p2 gnl/TRDRNA2_/TRDRNA2_185473_c0~~gnl/TRDRNA2_/TRDRNA2_185473_c0_seq1.p2  ORF type:complete len:230 (+),score=39.16 gnl/TRDRNA2_/TRDRNA2_185473_c0_seq1:64-753(+)